MDALLSARHAADTHKPSGRINAGDVGRCPWAVVAQRRGIPATRQPTPATFRGWDLGRRVEAMIGDAHREASTLVASQVHVIHDVLNVSGYIDHILGGTYGQLSWPITVQEVKSVKYAEFSRMVFGRDPYLPRRGESRPEGPKPTHMFQLATYRLVLEGGGRVCRDHEKDWGYGESFVGVFQPVAYVLTYICRETAQEEDYGLTDRWVLDAHERIARLNSYLAGEPAPCECDTHFRQEEMKYGINKGVLVGRAFCDYAVKREDGRIVTCCGRTS